MTSETKADDGSVTIDAKSAANKLVQLVDDDVTALSNYQLALIKENCKTNAPRYYTSPVP